MSVFDTGWLCVRNKPFIPSFIEGLHRVQLLGISDVQLKDDFDPSNVKWFMVLMKSMASV